MQDSGSLAVFKDTARDHGHYKGPSGAFVTYCNISCYFKCTLANECLSSNEISKKNGTVRGECNACDALFLLVLVFCRQTT